MFRKSTKVAYQGSKGERKEFEIGPWDVALPMDLEIGNDSPEASLLLSMKLLKPNMRASDTGVSSKNLLHWKTNDLLLKKNYAFETWSHFNFIEYLWIKIIQELRGFGVSFEIIKKIKDELIAPTDLYNTASNKYSVDELKRNKELTSLSHNEIISARDFYILFDSTIHFNNVLSECISRRSNFNLIVFMSGDSYFIEDGEPLLFKRFNYESNNETYVQSMTLSKEEMRFKTFVSISLTELIRKYVLFNKHSLSVNALPVMSANERELLNHINRKDVKKITVRYKNDKPEIIEVEENKPVVDMASRYTDHVMKNGYQTIEYITENGKMVSFSRTTKLKWND